MIVFLLGLLIGAFFGITFMAIIFMGKREDESCNKLYKRFRLGRHNQEQPHSIEMLIPGSYNKLWAIKKRVKNRLN